MESDARHRPQPRSSRRKEAHFKSGIQNSELGIDQSLLTWAATIFRAGSQVLVRRRTVVLVVAVLMHCLAARADIITDWNTVLLAAIKNESTSPPLASRNLAIVHAAIFDAVNAIERRYDSYLFSPNPPPGASPGAAAIGAAHECLIRLYPSQVALFDTTLSRNLAAIPASQTREDGLTLGRFVALLTLAWRSSDGSSTTVPYIPGTAPGDWRRTPPFFRPPELPHWPYVIPFAMTNSAQFRSAGPPSLTSTQYTRDFNLVKDLGALNSTSRKAEQTTIARFWSDFSFTVTPPGHWNQIAQNGATNRAGTLIENARLFALLNLAVADAGIACWDAKYAYNFWRPVTAIQQAANDGNDDTDADPNWTPLLTTPSFPEYVSGHSTFSAAAAGVLASFFGTDRISFTVGSDAMPGVFRSYESFEEAAEEIGMSRIYGGIHFLSADLNGLEAGQQLGRYVMQNYLRPVAVPAFLSITQISTNAFLQITVHGTEGRRYLMEESTNLFDWTHVQTNVSPFSFEQIEGGSRSIRFYRASSWAGN